MSLQDFICNAMELDPCNILAFDLSKNLEKAQAETEKNYPHMGTESPRPKNDENTAI